MKTHLSLEIEIFPNTNGEWRREIMTFTTDPNLTPRGHIRIDNNGSDLGNVTSKLWVRNIKLERGNKPTDWSPAPEDVESLIQKEQQAREQAIAIAKNANEAYARAQSELTKAQAIADANRNAGLAITAEQQARIQEAERNLQAAKAHAEREVSKINIGGRNLVLSSKDKRILRGYTGTFYLLSEPVKPNEQYMFSCNTEANGRIAIYFSDVFGGERQYISFNIQNGKSSTVDTPNRAWRGITIFHEVHGIIPTPTSSIELVKLERGNKPTDWSPAPEDVENQIANINSDLETIRQNAARIEDLENKNKAKTDERIGEIDQLTAFLNKTDVRGNVVATGTMIVGNTLGTQAGITGVGNATNEVRLFAGSDFAGRYAAPFRVLQDGTVYATKANISGEVNATSGSFTGAINATSGKIGGFTINSDYIGKKYGFYDTHDDQGCYIDAGGMCVWKRQYSREYDMKVLEFTTYGYYFIGFWVYPAGKNTPIMHRIIYRDKNKDQEYTYPSH